MSKRIFTKEQMEGLSKNPHVTRCSEKSVTYAKDFKVLAVKQYIEGLTSREIFMKAGLDPAILGRKSPKDLLRAWRKIFKTKGVDGLLVDRGKGTGGGRPKTKGITDTDKIKRLETEVAYLKAENDFLAKLRARRIG